MQSAIASNVKRIICDKGLKYCAVAAKAGYSNATFSNMLHGRKLVTDIDVANIANALDVTPNELFSTVNEQKES